MNKLLNSWGPSQAPPSTWPPRTWSPRAPRTPCPPEADTSLHSARQALPPPLPLLRDRLPEVFLHLPQKPGAREKLAFSLLQVFEYSFQTYTGKQTPTF